MKENAINHSSVLVLGSKERTDLSEGPHANVSLRANPLYLFSTPLRRFAMVSSVLMLSACSVTQVDAPSSVMVPGEFEQVSSPAGLSAEQQATAEASLRQWWRSWQDPVLTQLIETALFGNFDLQIAQSRLAESQAMSGLARADMGPQVGMKTGAAWTGLDFDDDVGKVYGKMAYLGFSASWEPDIFGAKRSDADAAHAAALADQERVYGAQLMLSSQLADHYVQLRSLENRLRIYEANSRSLNELLRYTQGRFNAGHVGADVVAQVSAGVSGLDAQRATLQAQRDMHERSIAVLSGQVPQGFRVPKSTVSILHRLPVAPQGQTPGDVLERRPDVRAKARAVEARAAQVASAKADLLPRFNINFLDNLARLELNGDAIPTIHNSARILSVGMTLPIFTAGRIQRNIEASDARLKTAALEYDQNILQALSEVDSLYQLQHSLQQQNNALALSLRQKRIQVESAYKLYQYGQRTLDEAIRVRLETYDIEDKQSQGLLAQAQNLLNLYKALGGGWREAE